MQKTKRWFHSATMMAFLAVVALFVSPTLAWTCCCTSAPVTTQSLIPKNIDSALEKESHSCCDEKMAAAKIQQAAEPNAETQVCSTIKPICECEKNAPPSSL